MHKCEDMKLEDPVLRLFEEDNYSFKKKDENLNLVCKVNMVE